MKDMPKIESGVPMPKYVGRGKPGRWWVVAAQMKRGDSVKLVGIRACASLCRQIVRQYGLGAARQIRTYDDHYRVWRVK